MKLFTTATLIATAAASAAPQITPRAELQARQSQGSDPALLGWVSAATFSDQRSCDFPATVSRRGNLAQCCGSSSCVFWSSCSAGTLFASQTSLFCDQGFCNTAVLVPTVGASSGQSYLGCWATSLGQSAFTIVQNIGTAPIASATGSVSGSGSARSSATDAASSQGGSVTQSSTAAAKSSGAAAVANVQSLVGAVGLFAAFLGVL